MWFSSYCFQESAEKFLEIVRWVRSVFKVKSEGMYDGCDGGFNGMERITLEKARLMMPPCMAQLINKLQTKKHLCYLERQSLHMFCVVCLENCFCCFDQPMIKISNLNI